MKYAFIMGRNPTLSVAELVRAVPGLAIEAAVGGVAIGACPELAAGFINLLGGTVKIAEVVAEFKSPDRISAETLRDILPAREGRSA